MIFAQFSSFQLVQYWILGFPMKSKRVEQVKCLKLKMIDKLLCSNPQWLPLWPEDPPVKFSEIVRRLSDEFWLTNAKTPSFAIYAFIVSQCEKQESGLMPVYKQKVKVIHSDRIVQEQARCRVGYFIWDQTTRSFDGWINVMKRVFFEHQKAGAGWVVDSFPRVSPQGYTLRLGDVYLSELISPSDWERRDFRVIVYKICLDSRFPDFHEAFLF